MSDLAAALLAQFGPGGLCPRNPDRLAASTLPQDTTELLCAAGLPAHVGVYFTAVDDADPDEAELEVEGEAWLRLGTDHGAQIAARPDGQVQALLPSSWGPARRVNATIEQLAGSLLILDRYLPQLAAAAQSEHIGPLVRRLSETLFSIDPTALSDQDTWWALVLEDIRHTVSIPFSAAAKYRVHGGAPQIMTAEAHLGRAHPELQLAERLAALEVDPAAISELYTELQACQLPGHYCAYRAAEFFPNASYTYAHPYGRDPGQRQDSLIALAQQAAEAASDGRLARRS